jgi:hypothetical protein
VRVRVTTSRASGGPNVLPMAVRHLVRFLDACQTNEAAFAWPVRMELIHQTPVDRGSGRGGTRGFDALFTGRMSQIGR